MKLERGAKLPSSVKPMLEELALQGFTGCVTIPTLPVSSQLYFPYTLVQELLYQRWRRMKELLEQILLGIIPYGKRAIHSLLDRMTIDHRITHLTERLKLAKQAFTDRLSPVLTNQLNAYTGNLIL